jgi:hypothetical protein
MPKYTSEKVFKIVDESGDYLQVRSDPHGSDLIEIAEYYGDGSRGNSFGVTKEEALLLIKALESMLEE